MSIKALVGNDRFLARISSHLTKQELLKLFCATSNLFLFQKMLDKSPWIVLHALDQPRRGPVSRTCRFFNYPITATFGPGDPPLIIHHIAVVEQLNGRVSGIFTDRVHSLQVLQKINEFYGR